jgi:ureidoglycolate hydrolase
LEKRRHHHNRHFLSPSQGQAFIALLAKHTDDITPDKFVAFYCDGSFGIHIDTGVWHQPVYPVGDEAAYYGKQGAVHACVAYDSVNEHDKWLYVPLDGIGA